jgi:hypothetical protein
VDAVRCACPLHRLTRRQRPTAPHVRDLRAFSHLTVAKGEVRRSGRVHAQRATGCGVPLDLIQGHLRTQEDPFIGSDERKGWDGDENVRHRRVSPLACGAPMGSGSRCGAGEHNQGWEGRDVWIV